MSLRSGTLLNSKGGHLYFYVFTALRRTHNDPSVEDKVWSETVDVRLHDSGEVNRLGNETK